jgi:hypothetical protein
MSTTPGSEKKFDPRNDPFFDGADERYDLTPDSGVHEALQNMDPEQRARQEEEWRDQLIKTEDEIQTLRQVLAAKVRESQDLKRRLGITVWREFRDDLDSGLKTVRDTEVYTNVSGKISEASQAVVSTPIYQKTETAVKSAAEATTSVFGTIGASMSRKLGDVKNSTTFKSFEERVGYAYTNVKEKMSNSRSNSMQNFQDPYFTTNSRSASTTPAATPTIHENKPLV